jgi:hypothetical protein
MSEMEQTTTMTGSKDEFLGAEEVRIQHVGMKCKRKNEDQRKQNECQASAGPFG